MKFLKKLMVVIIIAFVTVGCKNNRVNLKLEKGKSFSKKYPSYILDYTFSDDGGEKDTLIINTPITFWLNNNSDDEYLYENIRQGGYRYVPSVIIDKKIYNALVLGKKTFIKPMDVSEITYFFQTPVLKSKLEEEFKIENQLSDSKLGDSIVINALTPYIEEEINKNLKKEMFIIKLENLTNNKGIGVRYCFNKDKAIIYDVDSLLKANQSYMFNCDKDFYKKDSN